MRIIILLCLSLVAFFSNAQLVPEKLLSAKVFQQQIAKTIDAVIIDVRKPEEFKGGSIPKAINIDFEDDYFQLHAKQLDASKTYFIYCLSGTRSNLAADFLRKNGFKKVYELDGGMLAWRNNDLPILYQGQVDLADKISNESYQLIIKEEKVVLVDFYAPWCGPCKRMQPMLEEISRQFEGKAKIVRINIDENKKLSKRLGIDEIPFFKLYRNGKEIGNYIGELDRATFIRLLEGE